MAAGGGVIPGQRRVPIEAINIPPDAYLLTDLGTVTRINYFVTDGSAVRPSTAGFRATVDLADVEIGPNVTVGRGSAVRGSRLRDTIVGANSRLVGCDLHDSLVGSDVELEGVKGRVDVGDNSIVQFER